MAGRARAIRAPFRVTRDAVLRSGPAAPDRRHGHRCASRCAKWSANGGKNGEKAAAPPYQDELIDGGQLEPDIWNGDVPEREATGPPRGVRLDAIYSSVARGGVSESRYGAGVGAFLGTPLYGAWTVDGVFGKKPDSWVATVWQRDMPFEDGWRASNAGGNLNSPSIDLLRYQARWALPSTPLVGGLTEWRNQNGTQLTAGMGEPDVYTGLYVPGFRRLGGSVTTGGLQWAWDRNWTAESSMPARAK